MILVRRSKPQTGIKFERYGNYLNGNYLNGESLVNATDRPALTVNLALTAQLRGKPYLAGVMSLRGHMALTMSPGQWDELLQAGYDADALLVEVGDDGRIRRIFQKGSS